MTYDPDLVEDWVVGSQGFWRKGEVNANQWIVPFRGTWKQVSDRMDEMTDMEMRHARERRELEEKQQEERKEFWP